MTYAAGAPVLVGVDGSRASLRAVEWATREARRRGRALNLVYVNSWPTLPPTMWPTWGPLDATDGQAAGRDVLAQARRTATATDPAVQVGAEVVDGSPSLVLLDRTRGAALLVLGRRGVGGFAGLLLGSTAAQVATHAGCPVAVVPENPVVPEPDGPGVVLGVDGSDRCQAAIEYAFDEASLRRTTLTAVRAWHWPADDPAIIEPFPPLPEDHLAEQRRVLSEALAGWSEKYSDVTVLPWIAHSRPARALLEAAHGAELMVVGARGGGGFRELLLGSVSEAVIRHAQCPVVVVRGPRPPTPSS